MSDVRLWQTLIRHDEAYLVHFKCNTKKVSEYPNIFRYCVDMWQVPGIKQTTRMHHIKMGYFTSQPTGNYYGIIPKGPDFIG
jgi:putative glutathione S-transferase